MRFLSLLIVLGCVHVAHADNGYYVEESFGGGGMNGGLSAYGQGGLRVQLGFGHRRGAWTYELLGGAIVPDFLYIDCYGAECDVDTSHRGAFGYGGLDITRSWSLLQSRWSRLAVRASLHAGPRYFVGTEALTGYDGPGINAGARLEADAWVVAYFFDVGVDALWMNMPVDSVTGLSPHMMFGVHVGWL